MSVLDHNKRAIPLCNVFDEAKRLHFYVSDPNEYLNGKKQLDNAKSFTFMGSTVLILLLCIFTLNLNAAGWTAGNILTFGLVIVALYFVTLFGKKWLTITTRMQQMKLQGNPCLQVDGKTSLVHCNVQR